MMQERLKSSTGIFFALKVASERLNGMGSSKRTAQYAHGGLSPQIHSYSTFNRYLGVMKEFCQFSKVSGVNKLQRIDVAHIEKFLSQKIDKGLAQKTLKINMCALQKFFDAIGYKNLADSVRERFSDIYSQGVHSEKTHPFGHPQAVIDAIKDPVHQAVADLQYLTGSRIGDVKKIEIDGDRVVISGSKGGRGREISYADRPGKLEKIKDKLDVLRTGIAEKGWGAIRKNYYEDLKQACRSAQETYTGGHRFRASYATERYDQLVRSCGEFLAEKILTQELGHNRSDMSHYYRY